MPTCDSFCKKVFLPERERVEREFSKRLQKKSKKQIPYTSSKLIKDFYVFGCKNIYCQDKCPPVARSKNGMFLKTAKKSLKTLWKRSYTKKRKERLMKLGAKSGCRDLMEEYPNDYKNL